jgi:hypothetical protein
MSIEKEVNHPEFDLVNCPNVDCPQYGEHDHENNIPCVIKQINTQEEI